MSTMTKASIMLSCRRRYLISLSCNCLFANWSAWSLRHHSHTIIPVNAMKERTTVGSNVRTGVDNAFVAPVTIGDDAWIAAGSVITEDVPPGALAIARAKQVNKEGRG